MNTRNIQVCILRIGGTNCDLETQRAFEDLGVQASIRRSSSITSNELSRYHILVLPGGFSYGDYVRAGAVWGRELKAIFGKTLEEFVDNGKPILGICNGFQVLVEMGLLPAFNGISEYPEITLATNTSARYECRWVANNDFIYLKNENRGNCIFTRNIPEGAMLRMPIAHGEGRILFPQEHVDEYLDRLVKQDQVVFTFVKRDGHPPKGEYPANPNGSIHDLTGICNPQGNVFGLMPHPERAVYAWQLPDYTRIEKPPTHGDGMHIFRSVISYVEDEF